MITTGIHEARTRRCTAFAYDPSGNLTSDGTKTFEWDAENRLLEVKQGAGTLASFIYNGNGLRSTKTAGGITTSYIYDGAQFVEERLSVGSIKRYLNGPGIDRSLAQVTGGVIAYVIADHLGSIARLTDSLGAPTLTREYDPWGNLLQGSTTSGFAFTGREWEPEVGLYYYRARYFSSATGRFVSEDPLGLAAGLNGYRYARNNPLNRRDPFGLKEELYKTVQDAAVAGLTAANPRSIMINREIAFSVCEKVVNSKTCYFNTHFEVQYVDTGRSYPPPCPGGGKRAARCHTHGKDGNRGFSGGDIPAPGQSTTGWETTFVADPWGDIYIFDPNAKGGYYDKYRMVCQGCAK